MQQEEAPQPMLEAAILLTSHTKDELVRTCNNIAVNSSSRSSLSSGRHYGKSPRLHVRMGSVNPPLCTMNTNSNVCGYLDIEMGIQRCTRAKMEIKMLNMSASVQN